MAMTNEEAAALAQAEVDVTLLDERQTADRYECSLRTWRRWWLQGLVPSPCTPPGCDFPRWALSTLQRWERSGGTELTDAATLDAAMSKTIFNTASMSAD